MEVIVLVLISVLLVLIIEFMISVLEIKKIKESKFLDITKKIKAIYKVY